MKFLSKGTQVSKLIDDLKLCSAHEKQTFHSGQRYLPDFINMATDSFSMNAIQCSTQKKFSMK